MLVRGIGWFEMKCSCISTVSIKKNKKKICIQKVKILGPYIFNRTLFAILGVGFVALSRENSRKSE